MEISEFDSVTRTMIQHEDELTNHRMTWMCALQGLLFTAFGLLIREHLVFSTAICLVGFFSSLSLWYSMIVSIEATNLLIKDWEERVGDEARNFPRIEALQGKELGVLRLILPWRLMPVLFMAIWVWLIFVTIIC